MRGLAGRAAPYRCQTAHRKRFGRSARGLHGAPGAPGALIIPVDNRSRGRVDRGSIATMPDSDSFARRWAAVRARAGALDLTRPFRRVDALAAGITRSELAGPMFRRIFTGVYVGTAVPHHPLERVVAALLIHPPAAIASHTSAARVYGVPLPDGLADEHVSVLAARDRRPRPGLRAHVARPGTRVARMHGLRVSAPADTFVELAGLLTLVDLVVVGDFLARKEWVAPEELIAAADASGLPLAMRAARLVRTEVDSPMETRLRLLIVLAGLPEPKVNHKLYKADGTVRYRFDLSWPDLLLAVEYDGRQHRADNARWNHDLKRDEWLDDATWKRLPVFSWGIYKRPDDTLERVVKALRRRGCPDVPRRLDDEWRLHFSVKHTAAA